MSLDALILASTLLGAVGAIMAFQFSFDNKAQEASHNQAHEHAITKALLVFALFLAGAAAVGYAFRNLL